MLHDLADLEALWESIAEHSVQRQTWIEELDATLDQVENDRSNLVCKYFQLILLYKTVFILVMSSCAYHIKKNRQKQKL